MAPDLVQLPAEAADALAAQALRLGAPALVAAIERLGEILVELRHSPDPRVLIEVALVQLCRQRESGDDLAALAARVAKLERAAAAPAAAPGAGRPGDRPGQARRPRPAAADASPRAPTTATPARRPADPAAGDGEPPARRRSAAVWNDTVRPNLRGLTRALFAPVEVVAAAGDVRHARRPRTPPTRRSASSRSPTSSGRCATPPVAPITVRWESAAGGTPTPPVATRTSARRATDRRAPRARRIAARRSTAGRRCSNVSPRRSPAPRSSARTTERWPAPSPRPCRR